MGATDTRKIPLAEEVESIENETISDLKELHEEIREKARENCDSYAEADSYIQKNEQVRQQIAFYRDLKSRFEDILKDDEDARFVIKELTAHEAAQATDRTREESFDIDPQTQQLTGVPKEETGKILFASKAVVELPDAYENDETSKLEDVRNLPNNVFKWLWDEIDAHNTGKHEQDLSDFSLRGAWEETGETEDSEE